MILPRNLEIKVRIKDVAAIETAALNLGAKYEGVSEQLDTYFQVACGRLKLREVAQLKAELIYYSRSEENTHRWSDYEVFPIDNAEKLKEILSKSLGVKAVVAKRRKLYFHNNTRIHIDTVYGLGDFLEFEVLVEQEGEQQARNILKRLLRVFSVKEKDLIKGSYSDLMCFEQEKT